MADSNKQSISNIPTSLTKNQKNRQKRRAGNKQSVLVNIDIGEHYVFFSSLANSRYVNLYSAAQNRINYIANQIGYNNITQTYDTQVNSVFEQYLKFLKQLAQESRDQEIAFIKSKRAVIAKHPQISNDVKDVLEKQVFEPLENQGNIDYPQLLATIQLVLSQSEAKTMQELEYVLTQMHQQTDAIKQLTPEQHQELEITFKSRNTAALNRLLKEYQAGQITSAADLAANKIEQLLNNIHNNTAIKISLIATIQASLNTSNRFNVELIETMVIATVIEFIESHRLLELSQADDQMLLKEFENDFPYFLNKVSAPLLEGVQNARTKKKSLDNLDFFNLLRSGGDVASLFSVLDTATQDNIIAELESQSSIRDEDKNLLRNAKTALWKKRHTLEKCLLRYASNVAYDKNKRKSMSYKGHERTIAGRKELIESMGDDLKRYLSRIDKLLSVQDILNNNVLSCKVKIPTFDLGEYKAVRDLAQKALLAAIRMPGRAYQTKADVQIVFMFNRNAFIKKYENALGSKRNAGAIYDDLDSLLIQFEEQFQTAYVKDSNGATDVEKAAKAYLTELDAMYTKLKKILGSKKRQQSAENILQDLIFGELSVKEYKYGTNEFGFHAGSLGAGGRVQPVIHNIVNMYNLGGLTLPEEDLLIDAAINCGSDMLGANLKEPLSQLLLGAAAMMLFDQGFATSKTFQQKIIDQLNLSSDFNFKAINLIKVNSTYVPASFIYQTIYEQLAKAYGKLESYTNQLFKTTKNEVQIETIGSTVLKLIKEHNLQTRFEIVKKMALQHTIISYAFLGGLIDIIESIYTAFNPNP